MKLFQAGVRNRGPHILRSLCVAVAISGVLTGSGCSSGDNSDSPCSKVCACVESAAGSQAKATCQSKCAEALGSTDPHGACVDALAANGLSQCDNQCPTSAHAQSSGACSAWRQTGECSATGPREPYNDKDCTTPIDSGWSGFCECSNGTVPADCGHAVDTCDSACRKGGFGG